MHEIEVIMTPDNDRSKIFLSDEDAILYLIRTNRITNKLCVKCGTTMTIWRSNNNINGKAFFCMKKNCKHTEQLFKGTLIDKPNIKISTYLYAVYKWTENLYEKDVLRNLQISKLSFKKINKIIFQFINFKQLTETNEKLGGEYTVQVDETLICHGNLDKCPSKCEDNMSGITWLVGLIEEQTGKIKLIIVPDRKIETLKILFESNIKKFSTIITDGHPSYPGAVSHIEGTHIIVNHSKGFKNAEGFHTNNIENLWSIMKYEIKRRRGVLKSNISNFLCEFKYRYENLRKRSQSEIRRCWNEIIDYLFHI